MGVVDDWKCRPEGYFSPRPEREPVSELISVELENGTVMRMWDGSWEETCV